VVFTNNGFEIHYVADDNRIYLNSPNNGQRMEVTPDLVHQLSEVILEKNIPYGPEDATASTGKQSPKLPKLSKSALTVLGVVAFAVIGVAATLLVMMVLKNRKPKSRWSRFEIKGVNVRRYAQPMAKFKDASLQSLSNVTSYKKLYRR
jgi:hypothetical protein